MHSLLQVLDSSYFAFLEWKGLYFVDKNFTTIISELTNPLVAKDDSLTDYHLKDGFLYKLGLLCVLYGSYRS